LEEGRRDNVNEIILYSSRSSDIPKVLAHTSRHRKSGHIRRHLPEKASSAANSLLVMRQKMNDIETGAASISCEDYTPMGSQQSQSFPILIQDEASDSSALESSQIHISPNPIVSATRISPALEFEQDYTCFHHQEGSRPFVSTVSGIDKSQVSSASEVSQAHISRPSAPEEAGSFEASEVSQNRISFASEITKSALNKNNVEHLVLDSDLITANALGTLGHDDKYNIEEQAKQSKEPVLSTADTFCRDTATAQSQRCDGHTHDEASCKPMGNLVMPNTICHTYCMLDRGSEYDREASVCAYCQDGHSYRSYLKDHLATCVKNPANTHKSSIKATHRPLLFTVSEHSKSYIILHKKRFSSL